MRVMCGGTGILLTTSESPQMVDAAPVPRDTETAGYQLASILEIAICAMRDNQGDNERVCDPYTVSYVPLLLMRLF